MRPLLPNRFTAITLPLLILCLTPVGLSQQQIVSSPAPGAGFGKKAPVAPLTEGHPGFTRSLNV
jgi:hypothetical protein